MIKEQKISKCGFLWVDLEMTGLNPERDVILEIAVLGSDIQLERIVPGPSIVVHQPVEALEKMDNWVKKTHQASGLLDRVVASTISLAEAETQVLDFIYTHCSTKRLLLAGNTVYQDRIFIRRFMPKVEEFLHYRLIDVSTIKELVKAWYPKDPAADFVKAKKHRALDDILESIAELKHYRSHFFMP